jgi:histidinol-phosphate aminotransferase
MIPVYAGQVGARLTEVPWLSTPFPAGAVAAAAGGATAFLVSPNNPTGSVLTLGDLEQVAAAATHVVLDAAYGEFADADLSPAAVGPGNTVVVRTLSKAYGLAGLRVGYLLGPPDLVARIGGHGGPYPVAALSAAIAEARLCSPREVLDDFVAEVRTERGELTALLERLGTTPLPSQANFVLTRCDDAALVIRRAGELGVALRGFADRPGMEDMVRITLPGDRTDFARLVAVLESVLSPRNGPVP